MKNTGFFWIAGEYWSENTIKIVSEWYATGNNWEGFCSSRHYNRHVWFWMRWWGLEGFLEEFYGTIK